MLDRPGLGALDTMLCVTTISFDIAAMEVFLPLIVGAKVVLATETEVTDGIALQQLLIRHRVSVMQATPATWQLLLESGWRGDADFKMLCGGEALSRTLAERLLRCKGELWNMYGPTETTIWSSALRVESAEGPVLLGGPIANTQFYVLDSHGELAPPGAPGELYIGGDGVALGYQGMPALTRERFLPDKFSGGLEGRIYRTGDMVRIRQPGLIEYLGRTDQQIKLRGFRIELGEIESVLRRQGNIADAVATKGLDGAGEDAILAYVVLRGDSGSRADDAVIELRAKLSSALPAYMIPSSITLLDALPRTPNGKIDRRALPAPALISLQRSESAVSLNAVERRLSEIWASLLGVEHIGATEDFFELGGHSLLAARLIARIESEFGKRFSLVTLFRAPTIKAQAKLLEHGDPREFVFRQVVRVHPNGSKLPLIAINNTGVYYYNLAKSLGPDYPLLALQLFDPSLPQRMLPKTLEQIAAEYVGLIRQYQPTGPYQLIGWCVGGILAFEIACQLRQSGQEVSLLALIDTWVPGYMKRAPRWRAMLADYSYRCQLIWADWIKVMSGTSGMRQFLANRTLIKKIRHWYGSSAVDELSAAASQEEGKSDAERYDQWLLGYLEETAQQYQAKPYDGKVTLLCSASEPRGLFLDPKMGWGAYAAGGVEVDIIEGDHFSIFHDPGIGQMARSLSAVGKSVCETRFPLAG
jgi:thioesterase domain-containing protein/acyl carrier protein